MLDPLGDMELFEWRTVFAFRISLETRVAYSIKMKNEYGSKNTKLSHRT